MGHGGSGAKDAVPFVSVDDDLVTLLPDGRADVRSVRGRYCQEMSELSREYHDEARTKPLRHGERRADLSVQERLQPFLLLLGRAVPGEHLCNSVNYALLPVPKT